MGCPNCGVESSGDFKFCPRCGYQYDLRVQRPAQWSQVPARRDDSKVATIVIIVIVIVVVAPIILSALLYIMVLGFGGTQEGNVTPAVQLIKSPAVDGRKFTLTPVSISNVAWGDVEFIFGYANESVSWWPMSAEWSHQGPSAFYSGGPSLVDGIVVWLNITDLAGNGFLDQGDYFTITTGSPYQFSPTIECVVTLVYMPTGGLMVRNAGLF